MHAPPKSYLSSSGARAATEPGGQRRGFFFPTPSPGRATDVRRPKPGSPTLYPPDTIHWQKGRVGPRSQHSWYPLLPGGADVQHRGGGGLLEDAPLSAGPVSHTHAPQDNLDHADGEVCRRGGRFDDRAVTGNVALSRCPGSQGWQVEERGTEAGVCRKPQQHRQGWYPLLGTGSD